MFGLPGCRQLGEDVLVVKINLPSPYEMVNWFNYFKANFWLWTLEEYKITA
jgi:hypothetical protein